MKTIKQIAMLSLGAVAMLGCTLLAQTAKADTHVTIHPPRMIVVQPSNFAHPYHAHHAHHHYQPVHAEVYFAEGLWWSVYNGRLFQVDFVNGRWSLTAPPAYPWYRVEIIRDYGRAYYRGERRAFHHWRHGHRHWKHYRPHATVNHYRMTRWEKRQKNWERQYRQQRHADRRYHRQQQRQQQRRMERREQRREDRQQQRRMERQQERRQDRQQQRRMERRQERRQDRQQQRSMERRQERRQDRHEARGQRGGGKNRGRSHRI